MEQNRATLTARSARHATGRPDHVAVICEDRRLTYAELHRSSNRSAHALRAAGVGRGSRVAYLGRESEHYYDLVLGCAKVGAVLVPINWRLTAPEVEHVLHDSGSELMFVEGEFRAVAERARPGLPDLHTVVQMDRGDDRAGGLERWREGRSADDLEDTARTEDPVVQMYTSGTTGLPKGVVLAHRTFFTFIDATREAGENGIDWRPEDRTLICFPGLHSAGMAWFLHAFNVGATSIVMRMFVPEEAVRLIAAHRATTTWAAPAMLQLMLAEPAASRATFASLRRVVYGGSPISAAQLRRCIDGFGPVLAQMYAAAETGSVITCLPPADHVPGSPRLNSAGRVCAGNEIRIVGDDGEPLPPGRIGTVTIRTPAHFVEYWRRPEETARTLRDGWLHLGDAGYLDQDGYLFLKDRINDTIIVAGQNIYPVEVENALREHPDVADAAVLGVPDARWGEVVRACVVPRPGARITGRTLMIFLRGRIADFKIPGDYRFVGELPRNPTGKVLRRVLRSQFEGDPARGTRT